MTSKVNIFVASQADISITIYYTSPNFVGVGKCRRKLFGLLEVRGAGGTFGR
jgi:hypothetical protein